MKKYLKFFLSGRTPKTNTYYVVNLKDEVLGEILWLWKWRQYVFRPEEDIHLSSGCLTQITEFLKKMRIEQREGKHGSAAVK